MTDVRLPDFGHGSRFCVSRHRDMNRRRSEWPELKRLLGGRPAPGPSTFGLGAEEACRHAKDLRSSGWSRGEVARVLLVADECLDEPEPDEEMQ
jgi:hypothetical protein